MTSKKNTQLSQLNQHSIALSKKKMKIKKQETKKILKTIMREKRVEVEKSMAMKVVKNIMVEVKKEVMVRSMFAVYRILAKVHKMKENAKLMIY